MAAAAAGFGVLGPPTTLMAEAMPARPPGTKGRTAMAFGPLKQIDAGLLNIGYAEAGPATAAPVLLLHGWPYDIHSFVDVAPLLAAAGFRVITPHLRGHGTTRFLSSATVRNAQQSVVALDIVALMDALKIERAILAGYDWGARTANIIAALWPERCTAMVSVNGYLINNVERNKLPLPPNVEHGWWYQFYFATDRGRAGYDANRRDWRLGLADGELRYAELERRLALGPVIAAPTITLDGDSDGVAPASDGTAYAARFSGKRTHRIITGAGHNLPQEVPRAFADAVINVAGYQ